MGFPISDQFPPIKKASLSDLASKAGMLPIVISEAMYKMLPSSIKDIIKIERLSKDISLLLEDYFTYNKKHMRSKAKREFQYLVDLIKLNGK